MPYLEYSDAIFKGRTLQCRGRGSRGHNQTGHYRVGSKVHPGLIIDEATSVFLAKFIDRHRMREKDLTV